MPLAATLGLPFYINSEASLPLVRAMIDNGMSQGAALAFMISGAGTSIGAITGALSPLARGSLSDGCALDWSHFEWAGFQLAANAAHFLGLLCFNAKG